MAFTWHVQEDRPEDREKLMALLNERCDKYIFQLERGEGGSLHYQGRFALKTKVRIGKLSKEWLETMGSGVHLSPELDEAASVSYCMKPESRVCGPFAKGHKLPPPAYLGADLPSSWHPWQQQVLDYVQGPVHPREILWFYDPVGGCGKTSVCKYAAFRLKACVLEWGTARHIGYAVVSEGPKSIYMFDLTRTRPEEYTRDTMYSMLEQVKNGFVRSNMYEGGVLLMAPPHVVVFSNQRPSVDAMSADRWTIVELTDDAVARYRHDDRPRFVLRRAVNNA